MVLDNESEINIINNINNLLFMNLKMKFSKMRGINVSYKLKENGGLVDCSPAYLAFVFENKYWFSKLNNLKRNIFIFGKNQVNGDDFKPGNPILIFDFDKTTFNNPDCACYIKEENDEYKFIIKENNTELFNLKSNSNKEHFFDEEVFNTLFKMIDGSISDEIPTIISKEDQLKEKFMDLIKKGLNKQSAMSISNIKDYQINNWYFQGKKGEEEHKEFYYFCCKYLDKNLNTNEDNPPKKVKKPNSSSETMPKEVEKPFIESINEKTESKKCIICGKELNDSYKKDICKKCQKRRYAAKIILELLDFVEVGYYFKKEDFIDKFGKIKTNDYIWTLQEYGFLIEKDNKYALIDEKTLCKFIKINLSDAECPKNKPTINSITKTCSICGKTLPKNKFSNSKDYCKTCEKPFKAAKYLKQLLSFVSCGSNFKLEDISHNYLSNDILKGHIFELQENDLVTFSNEDNSYYLKEEIVCKEFLEKYLGSREIPIINKTEDSVDNEKVESLCEDKEDKKEIQEEDIEDIKEIQEEDIEDIKEIQDKETFKIIISHLKKGQNEEEACKNANISLETLEKWLKLGFEKKEPYVSLHKDYVALSKNPKKFKQNEKRYRILKNKGVIDKVFSTILDGGPIFSSFKRKHIKDKEVVYWNYHGKNGEIPFNEFYKDYEYAKANVKSREEETVKEVETPIEENVESSISKDEFSVKEVETPIEDNVKSSNKEDDNELEFILVNESEFVIKGLINDSSLFSLLNKLFTKEINVNSIMSTKIEDNHKILIELEVDKNYNLVISDLIKDNDNVDTLDNSTNAEFILDEEDSEKVVSDEIVDDLGNEEELDEEVITDDEEIDGDFEEISDEIVDDSVKDEFVLDEKVIIDDEEIEGDFEEVSDEIVDDSVKDEFVLDEKEVTHTEVDKEENSSIFYTEEDVFKSSSDFIKNYYQLLKKKIFKFENMELIPFKDYVAINLNNKNLIYIYPRDKSIRIYFNVNDNFFDDPENLVNESPNKHKNLGHYCFDLNIWKNPNASSNDFEYFEFLFKQLVSRQNKSSNSYYSTKKSNFGINYNENMHFKSKPKGVVMLYNKIKKNLKERYPNLEIEVLKSHINLKINGRIIASLKIKSSKIIVWFNATKFSIEDPKNKTRDVSNIDHIGVGDYEYIMFPYMNLYYFLYLFNEVYNL